MKSKLYIVSALVVTFSLVGCKNQEPQKSNVVSAGPSSVAVTDSQSVQPRVAQVTSVDLKDPYVLAVDNEDTEFLAKTPKNANVIVSFSDGGSPILSYAVSGGKVKAVQALLTIGADPNKRDDNGLSPIQIAIKNNSLEIIKLLIKYKADANAPTTDIGGVDIDRNLSALDLAKKLKRIEIVSFLTSDPGR